MEQLERAFARYRDGRDPAALGEVFDLAAPEVLRVATYLVRDLDFAEDLVQQTFLSAIESADRFEAGRPLMPWLLGILANQMRGQRRKRNRKPDPQRLQKNGAPDPAVAAGRSEINQAVRDAIAGIDEPYRAVLSLSLADGLTPKEIAASLDRPQGTVRSQLHRGLDLLRKALPLGFAAGALGQTRGLESIKAEVLRHAASPTPVSATTALLHNKALLAFGVVLVLAVAWGVRETLRTESPGAFRSDGPLASAGRAALDPDPNASEFSEPGATSDSAPTGSESSTPSAVTPSVSITVSVGGRPAAGVAAIARLLDGSDPEVYSQRGLTNADGRWEFGAPGAELVAISLASGAQIMLQPPEERSADVATDAGIAVSGRVVDANGAPVAGACIEASHRPMFDSLLVARSDIDGNFRIPHIAAGVKLTARAPRWVAASAFPVVGQSGDQVECTLRLRAPGASIRVRVVDEVDGPIADAVVLSEIAHPDEGLPARAVTDANGEALLLGIEEGTTRVVVRARGRQPWRGEVVATAGTESRLTAVMRRSARLHGVVTDAEGEPAVRMRIVVLGGDDLLHAQTFTDSKGRYSLDELPGDGPVVIRVGRPQGASVEQEFALAPGETREWNVQLPGRAILTGSVVDAQGRALARWLVHVQGERWNQTAITKEDGSFSLEVPDPGGTYTLRTAPYDDPRSYRTKETWRPKDGAIRLIVPAGKPQYGTIVGRIEDARGNPLGGIHVFALAVNGTGIKGAATAHRDGNFEIRNVVPGSYRVGTRDEQGRHPLLRLGEHDVSAHTATDIGTHRMSIGGRVHAQVIVPEGTKMFSAGVIGWWAGLAVGGKRLPDGSSLSGLLAPGTYTVLGSCYLNGKSIQKQVQVEVRANETTEVTVDLTTEE